MRPRAAPLRGYGGGQESPERARSHESGWPWSRRRSSGAAPAELAERVSRDRRRKRRCCARPPTEKSARRRSSAFFSIGARYSLAHTKAAARSGDAGNTDSPLGFLLGGLCGGVCRYLRFFVFYVMRTNVLSCLRWFEIADRVRNERVDGWLSSPL